MSERIQEIVVRVVRDHTLYSPERLLLDSHLEGELGVDSVMLASIMTSLRRELRLPDDRLKNGASTIRDLVENVRATLGEAPAEEPAPSSVHARPVIDTIRRHTHYDESHLTAGAHLEGELGIDSVVLTAIVADIVRDGGLPPKAIDTRSITTVGDLIERVASALGPARGDGERRPPKPKSDDGSHRTAREPIRESPMEETLTSPVAQVPQPAGAIDDTIASAGTPEADELAQLRRSVASRLPPVLRLEDCDTVEKLRRYIAAFEPSAAAVAPAPSVRRSAWDGRTMKDFAEQRDRDLYAKVRSFNAFYRERKADHLYWYGMALHSPCKNRAIIHDELTGQKREFLMFASNNYLGLANDPRVVDAICDATRSYGATNTGCRLIGGTNMLHKELERRLAKLKGREACIVYPSGYSANVGCISALAKTNDAVIADKLNHMSILDGCKLSGASRKIYQHNDMEDLARVIDRALEQSDGALIVTDGVFSMHGDICKLPDIVRIAKKRGAKVLVDDAHATGVIGKRGSGTAEHFNLKSEVDLELGTMSKALAGLGGFVVGEGEVVEYLRFYSNSYVFAANIPAGVAAGLIASIDVMEKEPERLTKLWTNIRHLTSRLTAAGFDLGGTESAIIPIVVGDDRSALELGRAVRQRGLFCQTVVYPGVAVGDARLRVSVTSEHTSEDLDLAADIFIDAAREVGVRPVETR